MSEYVFDTEAVIAYLYEEPDHETVATTLDEVFEGKATGSLSEANASEVFYLVARFEGTADDKLTKASLRVADRDLWASGSNGRARTDKRFFHPEQQFSHLLPSFRLVVRR